MADGVLHAGVGVDDHLAGRVIDKPDRQRHGQLTSSGFGELPAAEAGPDEVQLGFAHRALQAEQQPIVEIGRVV